MTQVEAEVSCKLCLRTIEKKAVEPVRKTPSLADLRAAAKAEKAAAAAAEAKTATAAPVAEAPAEQAVSTAAKKSVREEWQQRLAQMPGRNRLPRGVSRQSFI